MDLIIKKEALELLVSKLSELPYFQVKDVIEQATKDVRPYIPPEDNSSTL